jgi:quinol monooxygenase YgiN
MIRIVKMEFATDKVALFEQLFEERKHKIRNCEGCLSLSLLQDKDNPQIFFTYSHWQGPEYLELYRNSELFKDTWATVKAWFSNKAEAWSVDEQVVLS